MTASHRNLLHVFLLKWLIKSNYDNKSATFFLPIQFLFGVEKGNGHIYSQSKGRGFQKTCVVSPLTLLISLKAPILTVSRSCNAHSVGKFSAYIPQKGTLPQKVIPFATAICGPVRPRNCLQRPKKIEFETTDLE